MSDQDSIPQPVIPDIFDDTNAFGTGANSEALHEEDRCESLFLQALGNAPSPYSADNEVIHRPEMRMEIGQAPVQLAGQARFQIGSAVQAPASPPMPTLARLDPPQPSTAGFMSKPLADEGEGWYTIVLDTEDGEHLLLVNKIHSGVQAHLHLCFHPGSRTCIVRKAHRSRLIWEQFQRGNREVRIIQYLQSLERPDEFKPAVSNLLAHEDIPCPDKQPRRYHRTTYWQHYNLGSLQAVHDAYTQNEADTVTLVDNGVRIQVPAYKYMPRATIAKFVFEICSTLDWMYTAPSPVFHFGVNRLNCLVNWSDDEAYPTVVIGDWGYARRVREEPLPPVHHFEQESVETIMRHRNDRKWVAGFETPPPSVHGPDGRHLTDVEDFLRGIEQMVMTPHLGLDTVQDVYEKDHDLRSVMTAMRDIVEADKQEAKTDKHYQRIQSLEPIIHAASESFRVLISALTGAEVRRMREPLIELFRAGAPENPIFFPTKRAATEIRGLPGPFRVAKVLAGNTFAVDVKQYSRPNESNNTGHLSDTDEEETDKHPDAVFDSNSA